MIATDTLVRRGGDEGSVTGGGGGGEGGGQGREGGAQHLAPRKLSRHDSEDLLGSLVAEGMPDLAAAANLENMPEGEVSSRVGEGGGAGRACHLRSERYEVGTKQTNDNV